VATTPDAAERAGLAPTRTVLDNGLTVIAKETRKTPAVSIHLAVHAGSVCDPPDSPGTAHLLSRVIDRGTLTRSADEIATELDDRGISLTTGAARHLMSMACTCLADDFEPTMALLADIVRRPSIPADQLDTRRGEAITGLRQDEDNPYVRAGDGLMALLYGEEHPYGRHVRGTVTSLERIGRDELLRFHAEHFTPSAICLVVAGDVRPARAADVAASVLGAWQPPGALRPRMPVSQAPARTVRRTSVITMMNKAQAEIAYGFITVARMDPDHDALWLMNHVLGQYALGGRLGDSIRERQGMAYHVSSAFEPGPAAGPLVLRAGVSAANVDRAIQSIDEEVSAVVNGGITAAELDDSRRYLIGSLPLGLETNEGISQFLQTAEFFGLGLDYDVRLPALLRAVTLDRVHAVAHRYMNPSQASIVVAGPYARG
jgi:zinc protease